MGVLQRFERRLEGLVSGAFAKTFGGWVEPVEIAASLNREAENKKTIVAQGRVLVPNSYVVELGPADHERLSEYDEPLRKELASMVSEAAQDRGWSFVGPVEVLFELQPERGTGTFIVHGRVLTPTGSTGERLRPVEPTQPHLVLRAGGPGGADREVPINGASLVLGRGADADLRLPDTGVSRRHAEVRLGPEGAEVVDLDSTNGTRVNGSAVRSSRLEDGDRISVGTSELVFRTGR